jgi:hypothetical protein
MLDLADLDQGCKEFEIVLTGQFLYLLVYREMYLNQGFVSYVGNY